MQSPNPLRSWFDVFGRSADSHVDSVNRPAFDRVVDLLDVEPGSRGRCILLRAPRAGYGKTHLLSQVAGRFAGSHEFVLLSLADGSRIHPGSVLEDVLRRLCRPLPAGGGLTELDLLARRVLALGLEPLVRSGEVPCQDRDSALTALRERATETFDFHHPNAVTAHWARDNFGVLGPRLGFELSQVVGAPLRESVGWVEALFRFAASPVDQAARIGVLIEAAGGGASLDRLGALLQLISPMCRVVLVADEIEGLSSDPQGALRLAAFVTSLRQTAESADVIIALNRDLWDSAFVPRLSGGLEDRLGEWVIELEPLDKFEAEQLIESRVPGRGAELAAKLGLEPEDCHARGVLRRAAEILDEATAEPEEPAAPPVAADAVSPFDVSTQQVPLVVEKSPFAVDQEPEADLTPEPSTTEDFASAVAPSEEFAPLAEPAAAKAAENAEEKPVADARAADAEASEPAAEAAAEKPGPIDWATGRLAEAGEPAPSPFARTTEDSPPAKAEPEPPQEPEPAEDKEPEPSTAEAEVQPPPTPPAAEEEARKSAEPDQPEEPEKPEPAAEFVPPAAPPPVPPPEGTDAAKASTTAEPEAEPKPDSKPEPEKGEGTGDVASDRVDELLRQFRERYGRG